jgi:hypothetical protein
MIRILVNSAIVFGGVIFYACNEKCISSNVDISFSDEVKLNGKPVYDNSKKADYLKKIANSDFIFMHLMSDFRNDTARFKLSNTIILETTLFTDTTQGYTTTVNLPKSNNQKLTITLNKKDFSFCIYQHYMFIDVYYDRKKEKLKVQFNNTYKITY